MPSARSPNRCYVKIRDNVSNQARADLYAGRRFERELVLTQADFDKFAELSGDHNPIHVDPAYAAHSRFGATVSHGMLLFSAVRVFVDSLCADGRLQAQTLKFPAPAYADEPLRIELVSEGHADAGVLELSTRVLKTDGQLCLDGLCRILPSTKDSR